MIHVTQGHEKSISLEVFLKSTLCLSHAQVSDLTLHCFEKTLIKNLDNLKIKYLLRSDELHFENIKLKLNLLTEKSNTETIVSLLSAIKSCQNSDILLTLPSSKDQFVYNKITYSGHTDFFRHYYAQKNPVMTFIGPKYNIMLLTDHVAINNVVNNISLNKIIEQTKTVLLEVNRLKLIKRVIFSGINPHCGENGLIGDEDRLISQAVIILKKIFPGIEIIGPTPADTILFNSFSKNDLFIFSAHDQGLAPFKSINGLLGINSTFGLPFLRVSPDHGTAFDLYGKNTANYQGMLYLLNEILKI